jgi:HTH-like domain
LICQIHADSRGVYGYRRVRAELRLGRQIIVSRKLVHKWSRSPVATIGTVDEADIHAVAALLKEAEEHGIGVAFIADDGALGDQTRTRLGRSYERYLGRTAAED